MSRRLAYHLAASRADRALERVVIELSCPDCGAPVRCVVEWMDVEVPECVDVGVCYGASRTEALRASALSRAQGEREEYLNHLRDGGR